MYFEKSYRYFFLIVTIVMITLPLSFLHAQDRYVSSSGYDTGNDCSIPGMPCATIQHAVNVAEEGDTILIRTGVYTESIYIGKNLALIGEGPLSTIIQADSTSRTAGNRVITLDKFLTDTLSVSILNVTIRNGNATGKFLDNKGGGIYNEGELLLNNVTFRNNYAEKHGGGLYDIGSSTLENVKFIGNVAGGSGGGMFGDYGNKTIRNCKFIENRAEGKGEGLYWGYGGGLFLYNIDSAVLGSVKFIDNYAIKGGGAYGRISDVNFKNVVFEGNIAKVAGGGAFYIFCRINSNHTSYINNTVSSKVGGGGGGGLRIVGGKASLNDILVKGNVSMGANGGGGIAYSGDVFLNNTYFKLTNSRIINNRSRVYGGGIDFFGEDKIIIKNTDFVGNTSELYFGGGLYSSAIDTLSLVNCRFINNFGSAIRFDSSPNEFNVINSLFWNNLTGAIYIDVEIKEIMILNSTFVGNTKNVGREGGGGGAIFFYFASSPTTIVNSIFWNNDGNDNGNAIHADNWADFGAPIKIYYTNISTSPEDLQVDTVTIGPGVVYYNPQFISDTDFRLSDESPLINMGDPDTDLSWFLTDENGDIVDLAGNLRIIDDTIDMGVYENQSGNKIVLKNIDRVNVDKIQPYPNPTMNLTTLILPEWALNAEIAVKIYNSSGTVLYSREFFNVKKTVRINTSDLYTGKYFISIQSDDGKAAGKLIVVH